MNYLLFYSLVSGTLMLNADISGVVFEELPVNGAKSNSYGVKDSNERGVASIKYLKLINL